MYVEDRTSYNGPVQVSVKPTFTLAELKEHVECEFEIPVGVQKWILGKSLAEDNQSTLSSHGINKSGQSIYLYLVASATTNETKQTPDKQANEPSKKILPSPSNPTNGENRKGRYWNYEEDRWSYCSDSEDEEPPKNPKNETVEKAESESEEGDYEWEYFYEDAELKKEATNKTETPANEQPALQAAVAGPSGKTQRVNPRDGWECPTCTLLNEPTRPGCEACTTERPKDYQVPAPGPADTIPRTTTNTAAVKNVVKEVKAPQQTQTKEKDDILKNYQKLDDLDIIPNAEQFECIVCYLDIEPGDGVVLRECLHTFCK